jgi:hypothetical protein
VYYVPDKKGIFYTITAFSNNRILRRYEGWTENIHEVADRIECFKNYTSVLFPQTPFIVAAEARNDDDFELICTFNSTRDLPWNFCVRDFHGKFIEWREFKCA